MAKDGRTHVKPGGLAQMTNNYDLIKQETIERNNKRVEALGLKPLPTSLSTSLLSSTQTTAEGKRKVDWDNDGDEDYHPAENEEGLFSSSDDDEFYWSEGKKRTVKMNKQRIVKKKQSRWPAGAMDATSQPSLTTSQQPPSPTTDQTQPQPAATTQLYPPLTKTKKLPRWPVGAMAATSQPSPTTSQLPSSPITDQTLPQPAATTQLYPPPTKTKKLPRWPVGAMAATPQPLPTTRKKLEVVLDTKDQPIGDTGSILQSQLGILARNGNLAPLLYTDWRAPQLTPYKERIWAEVKERSITNLANRDFQTMGHTSGRKAHCRVRAELAKEKGVEPDEVDRITLFERTRTKSDGNPVDKASEIAMARLKEGISQVPESLQSPTFKEEVFGMRFTRSQELRDREQLREELRKEEVDEVRREVVDEVRKEVLAEFGERFSSLERKCARFEAHAKDIGYPLSPSPEANSPTEPSHIKQLDDPI
ncbi:hypothetical protein Vadar_017361 [Vaccinium darrowii]|uniref:Uncharacterized protein n=1 Tax=Vaccinium darrowii TaxID=229202 RepID=A0ACB7XI58_9ERIC|nr:hypothetical protein Vadar_017361 [Vaccinium darrowii]